MTLEALYFRKMDTSPGGRNDGSVSRTRGVGFPPPFVTLLTAYWCGTVLTWQVAEPSSHSSMVGMTQL
jgi:hypothetical protein